MFVTYLTIYEGDRLPPYYIGSTTVDRIEAGYHGSVRSKKYQAIWDEELKLRPELFDTLVLGEFATRAESLEAESALHLKHKVVTNPLFINMGVARGGFINPGKEFYTDEVRAKMSTSAKARIARGGLPKPKVYVDRSTAPQSTKDKMSAVHKAHWADPAYRERMLARNEKIRAAHQAKRDAKAQQEN